MSRFLVVGATVAVLFTLIQPAALQAQEKKGQAKKEAPAPKAKAMSASGTVKSVSSDAITITAAGGKEMKFNVDNSTKFVGKGLSTKTREKGGKLTPSDAVGTNDRVTVSYRDTNGSMHAETVTVTAKSTMKK